MNQERLKWIFVVLVGLSGVWLILKLIPPLPMGQKIAMTVIKQKGSIANLDTPRKVDFTKHFWVDTINFKEGKVLEHPKWGNYGFQNDFFIEFEVGPAQHGECIIIEGVEVDHLLKVFLGPWRHMVYIPKTII